MGATIGLAFKALITSIGGAFTAWKLFSSFLLTVVLGIVLYNLVVDVVQEVIAFVNAKLAAVSGGELPSGALQLTGLGAWLAQETYLDAQIGIAITAISLKWLVVKIPFLKW